MAEGKICVSPEGVKELKSLASRLEETVESTENEADILMDIYESNKDGLGPHADEVGKITEDVKTAAIKAHSATAKISEKIVNLANEYESIINDGL